MSRRKIRELLVELAVNCLIGFIIAATGWALIWWFWLCLG